MSLELLTYFSMIYESDWRDTLLVTIIIHKGSEQMKSTRTSDFTFLRDLLMLETCNKEFFMKLEILSLSMGMMTCFLKGLFVVISMWGLDLRLPLIILLIWLIFCASMEENAFLILMTLDVLIFCFDTWAYDSNAGLELLFNLLLLKYFGIMLTSFWDFAEIGKRICSICVGLGLLTSLLFLPIASWCQDRQRWTLFIFIFSFIFSFFCFYFAFIFYFLFLEQLRLGVISHAVTSVTTWWHSHETDHGT